MFIPLGSCGSWKILKTKQQVNIKWRKLHNFATGIKIQNKRYNQLPDIMYLTHNNNKIIGLAQVKH